MIGNASTFDFYEKACGAKVVLQQELDEKFIRRANELAELAKEKGEDPFGAVLVRNNQIIHECHDGCIAYCDPTMHAERRLISEYCSENKVISLEDCTLYSSAEPCAMCSGAIHWAKIPRIVFGIPQEKLNKKSGGVKKMSCSEIVNQGKINKEVVGPVLEEESYKVIADHQFILKKLRV